MKKTIGIIGGMGPLATSDLFNKIVTNTQANCDKDHCHIIIDNVPTIPNRGDAILNNGISPLPYLLDSGERLKQARVDFFIMPCNTAHYWFDELTRTLNLPGLSIVDATAKYLVDNNIHSISLLATTATIKANIYSDKLSSYGINTVVPDNEEQNEIMRLIYDCIKANKHPGNLNKLVSILDRLKEKGAEQCVLACTELPILFGKYLPDYPVIDTTLILARAAIKYAGYSTV